MLACSLLTMKQEVGQCAISLRARSARAIFLQHLCSFCGYGVSQPSYFTKLSKSAVAIVTRKTLGLEPISKSLTIPTCGARGNCQTSLPKYVWGGRINTPEWNFQEFCLPKFILFI